MVSSFDPFPYDMINQSPAVPSCCCSALAWDPSVRRRSRARWGLANPEAFGLDTAAQHSGITPPFFLSSAPMVCPPIQQPGREPRELMGSGPIPAMTAAISVCFRMLTYHLLVSGLNTHDPAYPPVIKHSNGQYTISNIYIYNIITATPIHKGFAIASHCHPLPCLITGGALLTFNTRLHHPWAT